MSRTASAGSAIAESDAFKVSTAFALSDFTGSLDARWRSLTDAPSRSSACQAWVICHCPTRVGSVHVAASIHLMYEQTGQIEDRYGGFFGNPLAKKPMDRGGGGVAHNPKNPTAVSGENFVMHPGTVWPAQAPLRHF